MDATKVKGTVTKLRKSRYFKRLSKYVRFKSLLKQLDESGLLDIVRQVVSQTRASDRKRTLTEQNRLRRWRNNEATVWWWPETPSLWYFDTVVFYVDWCYSCSALNTSKHRLKSILWGTRSQCSRSRRVGLMCSKHAWPYTICLATLRTDWIRLSWYFGIPVRMLLQ